MITNLIATVRNEDIGGVLLLLVIALSFGVRELIEWLKDVSYYRARTIVRNRDEATK